MEASSPLKLATPRKSKQTPLGEQPPTQGPAKRWIPKAVAGLVILLLCGFGTSKVLNKVRQTPAEADPPMAEVQSSLANTLDRSETKQANHSETGKAELRNRVARFFGHLQQDETGRCLEFIDPEIRRRVPERDLRKRLARLKYVADRLQISEADLNIEVYGSTAKVKLPLPQRIAETNRHSSNLVWEQAQGQWYLCFKSTDRQSWSGGSSYRHK